MTLGFVGVILSIKIAASNPYLDIYGPIPFVIGYTLHFLLLLVAIISNIELFKSDNIEAVEEIKNLQILNFWCDLYNCLIGIGVFCFGPEGFYILGLAYIIINMSPIIFMVIFNANMTMVSGFLFRAAMFILQTVCFAFMMVVHQDFLGKQGLRYL